MKIEERIKSVLSSVLEMSETDINDETSTDNNANWDSIRHLNLILALEEEFEVSIPDEEIGTLTDFKAIRFAILKRFAN